MKKDSIAITVIVTIILLVFPVNIFALNPVVDPLVAFFPPQTLKFYVNDAANILSTETENYIIEKSTELNKVDGTQIVVVTVPNLGGYSIEEYANTLFNYWGIGDSEKNNGLLLLLALQEREFRVEVGDGLGGILPDAKTGRFQDEYIIPHLKNNEWDKGVKNGYNAFYAEIVKLNNLDLEYNKPFENQKNHNRDVSDHLLDSYFIWLVLPLSGGVIGLIIALLKEEKRKLPTQIYLITWFILFLISTVFAKALIILDAINLMIFLTARYGYLHETKNWTSGNSAGGSFGGGSSYSSGSSSGGGSSGGGGRSSGGGSSRRF
ncbi:MAG: TPM domain-containing protein [Bacilli bacterium]|nr:TPM domain-containing protein [Bacilli bacterium]